LLSPVKGLGFGVYYKRVGFGYFVGRAMEVLGLWGGAGGWWNVAWK